MCVDDGIQYVVMAIDTLSASTILDYFGFEQIPFNRLLA